MVRVKVCGLTNVGDALHAAASGADALGFIAVPESPRFVPPETVAQIVAALPPFVTTVCVARTVDDSLPYPTDWAQVYSDVPEGLRRRVLRVFRIRDGASVEQALRHAGPVLLDAYHEAALGGTGIRFDPGLAADAVRRHSHPVILAGGLTPENVAEAVRSVRPYGVDVASGVEAAPGTKDPERVARFISAAKEAT